MTKPIKKTLATVAGGIKATATLRDFEGNTSEETVFIRELPIRQLQDYVDAMSRLDEPTVVELFCGKEPGWSDRLLASSHEAILQKGEELNRPILDSWMSRSRATMGQIAKQIQALAEATSQSPTS